MRSIALGKKEKKDNLLLFCVLFMFKILYLNTENVSDDHKQVMSYLHLMKRSSAKFLRLKCGPCNEFLSEKLEVT